MTATLDSSAWVEYLAGTKRGERVRQILQTSEEICTSAISIVEIKSKFMREGKPYQEYIDFICERSRVVSLSREIALQAAGYKARGLHTADAVVYATARAENSILLTGDYDFKNLAGAELL